MGTPSRSGLGNRYGKKRAPSKTKIALVIFNSPEKNKVYSAINVLEITTIEVAVEVGFGTLAGVGFRHSNNQNHKTTTHTHVGLWQPPPLESSPECK
jgi:hypothetical protein